MSDIESNFNAVDETQFPPGTVRLSDKENESLVLAPQPTSDPNDPLVCSSFLQSLRLTDISSLELVIMAQNYPDDSPLTLRHHGIRLSHRLTTTLVRHEYTARVQL